MRYEKSFKNIYRKNKHVTMHLGATIHDFRMVKKLSQAELAQAVGVTENIISDWELGTVYPTISQLTQLSDVLEISLVELLIEDLGDIELIVYKNPAKRWYWLAVMTGILSILATGGLFIVCGRWAIYVSSVCLSVLILSVFKLITYRNSQLFQTYCDILTYVHQRGMKVEENQFLKKSEHVRLSDIVLLILCGVSTGLFIGIVYPIFS